ncbi:MAG: trypsin-like serine protease [Ruminococcaceae bacterium]|nr:trypsin-like serine protease [Oscillospiraceae bacterium]
MAPETERSAWYDQRLPAGSAAGPKPNAAPRKPRRAGRIAIIIVCVLILLTAAIYILISPLLPDLYVSFHENSGPPAGSDPPPSVPSPPGGSDGVFSDDYREFFENFFIQTEAGRAPSTISRGETGSGFTLTLNSAAERSALSLQELYKRCINCVVGIRATADDVLGYYWGTGIILSEDGYILTNQHILSGTSAAEVILPDGTACEALLIGEDATTDLAVLKIDAAGLQPAEFGDSDELTVGDSVAAIGNPLTDNLSGTLTDGIVSAINRTMSTNGYTMTLIQTTAALNEGNSGGPLFNSFGQVVGITNMKMVNNVSGVTVEGIGFAIPSTTVKLVVDQLVANGVCSRPGMGITVGAIPPEAAEHYDLPEGLYITAVSEGSSAEARGVRPGDVLLKVDGIDVRSSSDVLAIRDTHVVGDDVLLTIYRGGKTFDIAITLGEYGELY